MTTARIYKPAKNAMQSARGRSALWVLEYQSDKSKGPESLMGWTASDDTQEQVRLTFKTFEAAQAYAEAEGLAYNVSEPQERKVRPRNYGDNFKYIPADSKN
jgi:hypothetical protein